MARTRGHTRKKKARLTTENFSAVMEIGRRPARAEADPAPETAAVDVVEFDILELLRAEPDTVSVPTAYNDPSSVFAGATDFATDRYVLGLIVCPECRNEMMYYQRRDVLAAGYRFRCRICQHELLATLD